MTDSPRLLLAFLIGTRCEGYSRARAARAIESSIRTTDRALGLLVELGAISKVRGGRKTPCTITVLVDLKTFIQRFVLRPKQRPRRHQHAVYPRMRFAVLTRDRFTCLYCGRRAPDVALQVDHIVPFSKGGETIPENLATACRDCNISKSDIELPGKVARYRNLTRYVAKVGALNAKNDALSGVLNLKVISKEREPPLMEVRTGTQNWGRWETERVDPGELMAFAAEHEARRLRLSA